MLGSLTPATNSGCVSTPLTGWTAKQREFVAFVHLHEVVGSICASHVTLSPSARTVIVLGNSTPRIAEVKINMRKRLQNAVRLALGVATLGGIGLLGAFGAGAAGAAAPASGPSPVIGHVYLDDNTAGTNTISGFDRHLDGSLTPLAGSPFVAGGAGTGAAGGLASQGAVQVTNDGRFLIAVDAGSNQLSVLRINFDGSLQLVPNGVVSSDGPTPVSVAVHDGLVYVANAAAVGPNYTGFTLSPSDSSSRWPTRLSPFRMARSLAMSSSTRPVPTWSGPGWEPRRSTALPLGETGF